MAINDVVKKVFVVLFLTTISIHCQIRIVLTAAVSDYEYEFRKNQYIESFAQLKKYGYENFYVVEALCKQGPTFLDDYSKNVFYSKANNTAVPAGMNEQKTLYDALIYFGFDDEDMIIKLTGRHQFISDDFIKIVESNPDVDAFFKCIDPTSFEVIAFAMRCKYLKKMSESIDYAVMMAPSWLDLETTVGSWFTSDVDLGMRIKYVDSLGVRANTYGSLTAPGIAENIVFK